MKIRKPLKTFSIQMELVLQEYDESRGKEGWKDLEIWPLLERVQICLNNAKEAYRKNMPVICLKEIIDAANLCMMINDNVKERKGFFKKEGD